jgi:hypothetical protein
VDYITICDELWARIVKQKAGNQCEYCGGYSFLQAHHIIPRTYWSTRYLIPNGVCLCSDHHIPFAHNQEERFKNFIKDIRDMDFLISKKHSTEKLDFQKIYEFLLSELQR